MLASGPSPQRGRIPNATKYRFDGIGDSYTSNGSTGLVSTDFYPYLMQNMLQARGCSVVAINSGVSGDSTGQMLVRARLLSAVTSGSVAVIYGGTNDINGQSTVQASPSPTTTTFSVAAGQGAYYKASTFILLNGVSVAVASVSTDAITVTPALGQAPAAGQTVKNDTMANIVAIGSFMSGLGYTNQLVGLQHYLNFTTGGDTLAVPESNGVIIRAAQNAAATAMSMPVADFYTYDRNLIVNGTVAQGSFTWHVADANSHRNVYGEQLLADCVLAALPNTYLAALRI